MPLPGSRWIKPHPAAASVRTIELRRANLRSIRLSLASSSCAQVFNAARCAILSCRQCGSRISGGSDVPRPSSARFRPAMRNVVRATKPLFGVSGPRTGKLFVSRARPPKRHILYCSRLCNDVPADGLDGRLVRHTSAAHRVDSCGSRIAV
jgi:hypothetical protein